MKGILMTPDNIRATAEERKTQTRRPMNPQPFLDISDEQFIKNLSISHYPHTGFGQRYSVGDIVYIKEAWATEKKYDNLKPSKIPSDAYIHFVADGVGVYPLNITLGKWRSPMFMPAWVARYFIRILDVRPERLQEIGKLNHDDCLKEGYPFGYDITTLSEHPANTFARYWDSINRKYPWESNPFVWVYSFAKYEPSGRTFSRARCSNSSGE